MAIQQKTADQNISYKQTLDKALRSLKLQKAEIEKEIEKFLSTNHNQPADETEQSRNTIQVNERRREYYQVLNDLKNITKTQHYH